MNLLPRYHLPPATVVPFVISTIHLIQDHPHSVDCAVQYMVFGAVCCVLENMIGAAATWVLMAPFVVTCVAGMSFQLVGDTFFRESSRSKRPSAGCTTSQ